MIVIHIDSSDELNTLVNRIRSSDETQVILVLPEKYQF